MSFGRISERIVIISPEVVVDSEGFSSSYKKIIAAVRAGMLILHGSRYYKIMSIEDIKGRGMYLECLCEEVVSTGKS
jgi:head-tail adaptor